MTLSAPTWRQHDPAARYDALVVGSGIGGLTTAALLARHGGRRVLVLERHWTAGGFTHVFRRPGFEWDVGVHYIGDVQDPAALTRRLFDHLTGGRLQWAPMGDPYDRIVVAGEAYDFPAGPAALRDSLVRHFPTEGTALDRYLGELRAVSRAAGPYFMDKALPGPVSAVAGPLLRRAFLKHARRTTGEVLAGITGEPRLRTVLAGQWGDYGLPPGRSSFAMHAILARHYLRGASYPVGGASQIAAGIVPLIEAAGGRVLVGAEVTGILVAGGRARGVRMADGTEVEAPVVVSDAGVANTFTRLLPPELGEQMGYAGLLHRVGASLAHLGLYVGLDGSAAELGLPRHNLWVYPGDDHDASVAAFTRDPEAPLPVAYVSFPSAKDPDFTRRFPGHATVQVITLGPYRWFAPWQDAPWRRRGPEYEAFKARFARRMLDVLEAQVPAVRGHVAWSELSTPLSTRQFASYAAGEVYGLEHSPARFAETRLRPRTPVRGLFLTGQDVLTCGVAGALAAGVLTASAVLGRNLMAVAARGAGA